MAQNRFASVPNISIPRSRFKQPFNHATSFNHGKLIPIDCFEILPGDEYKLKLNSLIWMSNPIVPIFGNIHADIYAFFVPMRLIWEHTAEFYGENKTSAGYPLTTPTIPMLNLNHADVTKSQVGVGSVSHYLGKPIYISGLGAKAKAKPVSVLKERGFWMIYNEYFRAQQLQNPVILFKGDRLASSTLTSDIIGSRDGSYLGLDADVPTVCKEFDYFTAATKSPQFGGSVELPLGTYAPVVADGTKVHSVGSSSGIIMGNTGNFTGSPTTYPLNVTFSSSDGYGASKGGTLHVGETVGTTQSDSTSVVKWTNLITDLSTATAATINDLRYAFAVQKYLERSNFGSRFFEMLSVHYGITSPDASLQLPQRLGHGRINISVNTVLSTAGAASDSSTELGRPGAVSCSARKDMNLFTAGFQEPGYLYVLIETKHERTYTQGIMREDSRLNRFEFYSPEFANLGDQSILKKEIYYGLADTDNDVFGYQEHWAEYRYRPQRVSGMLDPQVANALDFWTLADDYSTVPSLDDSWILEDRDSLARALVTSSTGPDYIGDFYFDYTATREMPFFTIPGLIDHFGSY